MDDHVCKKIRMPHFIISCQQISVQYYLYRTSTNAFIIALFQLVMKTHLNTNGPYSSFCFEDEVCKVKQQKMQMSFGFLIG